MRLVNEKYSSAAAVELSEAWRAMGAELARAADELHALADESVGRWAGVTAERARDALRGLGDFTGQTGAGFVHIAHAVQAQGEAAVQAHNAMPAPVADDTFERMRTSAPGDSAATAFEVAGAHERRLDAEAEAVRVLQQRDKTMRDTIERMPPIAAPPAFD